MSLRDLIILSLPTLFFLGLYAGTAYWMWQSVEKKQMPKAKKRLLQIAGLIGWPLVPYFYFLWPRPYAAHPSKNDKPLGPVGVWAVRTVWVLLAGLGLTIIAGIWRV